MNSESVETKSEALKRMDNLFVNTPVWKAILKMSMPALLIMLILGMYNFADSLLSVNFAHDSYSDNDAVGKDLVRVFMSATQPVNFLIMGLAALFGIGVGVRYSINMGNKNEKRAIQTIQTGMVFAGITSAIAVPILLLLAPMWSKAQFNGHPQADIISTTSFKYTWIIIITIPIQIFNQIIGGVFRAEGKNKQMVIISFAPIIFNLFSDWLFMGPFGMGIEGGAWATFISYSLTGLIPMWFIYKMRNNKETNLHFSTFFNLRKIRWIAIVGILLAGLANFIQNSSTTVTSTYQQIINIEVSQHVYGTPIIATNIITGVFPIFALVFPIMYGFIQGGSPVLGYNFGHKNYERVKTGTKWIFIYSLLMGIFLFIVCTFILGRPLLSLLGVSKSMTEFSLGTVGSAGANDLKAQYLAAGFEDSNFDIRTVNGVSLLFLTNLDVRIMDKSQVVLGISMLGVVFFAGVMSGSALFTSTDRFIFNIFSAMLRGIVFFFPVITILAWASGNASNDIHKNITEFSSSPFSSEYIFWWFNPLIMIFASLVILVLVMITLKSLHKEHVSTDERIDRLHIWARKLREKRAAKKLAKKEGN